jgi:hypothetical protein
MFVSSLRIYWDDKIMLARLGAEQTQLGKKEPRPLRIASSS